MRRSPCPSPGFTLIELVIAMAVATVLLAVALPGFQSAVRQGRRAEAVDAALAVMHAQERWRGNNAGYSTALDALGQPATSAGGYYALALDSVTTAGYTLTLSGVAGKGQENDSGCGTLTVSLTNGSPAYAPAACWKR